MRATGVRKVTHLKVTQREIAGALRAVITAGLDARRVEISSAGNIIIIDVGGLRRHLNALPRIGVLICTNANGQPTSANDLSGAIRRAVEATPGIPHRPSIHGLHYAAASRMEEGGATVAQLEAVLGHRTFGMALKYASQRLRAQAGVEAMGRKRNDG